MINHPDNGNYQRAIIIPLDGSRTAARAFGAAEAVARLLEASLHVVYVGKEPQPEEQLLRLLNLGQVNTKKIIFHQPTGQIVNAILELGTSLDASMIVMSSHGRTHDAGLVAGSVTMNVIQQCDIPVMVVRPLRQGTPDRDWQPGRMLIPHDGSPVTASEVDQVFSLAQMMGADIDVLHVAVSARQPVEAGAFTGPRYLDRPHYDWSGWADEFMRRFAARQPEANIRLVYRTGGTVAETLAFAREQHEDMIALIWRGQMAGERAATVKGILRQTEVPVLLKRIK